MTPKGDALDAGPDAEADGWGESGVQGELHTRLEQLRARGGETFDAVGVGHVDRLQRRAEALPERARERLLGRALTYLTQLEGRYEQAGQRARDDLERLERLGLDGGGRISAAYASSDFAGVRRAARRRPWTGPRVRDEVRDRWEQHVGEEVERRGISSPGTLDAPDLSAPDPVYTLELSMALYRDAAAGAQASMAIARAVDALPAEAGRYHATTVATRALQAMQAAPHYLKAQLARIEVADLIEQYAAAPAKPAKPVKPAKRTKRRGARKD